MVSIIVNCYNGEQYLADALESIKKQTFQDYEVIFWDNCSTDGSLSIAKDFGEKLKVYKGERFVGLGEARNLAIEQATGEYIAFLDCDDLWEEKKLEKQVKILEAEKEIDLVTTNFTIDNVTSKTKKNNKWNILNNVGGLHEIINVGSISTSACVFRKSAINSMPYVFNSKLKYTMDFELYTRIATTSNVFFINEPLTVYRVHRNMTTKKVQGIMFEEYNMLIDSITGHHPNFMSIHPEDIYTLEYTRDFLEAKYLLTEGQKRKARSIVKPHLKKPKAIVIYLLTLFPFGSCLWRLAYRRR